MRTGRWAEAEALYRRAIPVMDAKSDPLDAAYVRFRMGQVLRHNGKLDEAAAMLRSSLEVRAKELGDGNEATQAVLQELVAVSMEQGKPEAAEALRARLVPSAK
jgi:tetratricopeptide (TPR) repeat protein